MTEQLIHIIKKQVIMLLQHNKVDEALKLMDFKIAPISEKLETSITLNFGNYSSLKQDKVNGLINKEDFKVGEANIRANLIGIMATVDDEVGIEQIMGRLDSVYVTNYGVTLEKIQGTNNLKPINWMLKGIEASKSVCQVVMANGDKGTGWVLEDGWLMTNHHVIPTKEKARTTKIVFDYEDDIYGVDRKTSEYRLYEETAIFSNLLKLDYAYIKIKDDPDNPLSQWGHLKVNTLHEPKVGDLVSIIQHPLGQKKQIALTENNIVGIDNEKLFYKTDTERGSSGAPVFNSDWEVVALHHAGKTEEQGGINVNGEQMGVNEGILIRYIMEDIERQLNS